VTDDAANKVIELYAACLAMTFGSNIAIFAKEVVVGRHVSRVAFQDETLAIDDAGEVRRDDPGAEPDGPPATMNAPSWRSRASHQVGSELNIASKVELFPRCEKRRWPIRMLGMKPGSFVPLRGGELADLFDRRIQERLCKIRGVDHA
jgi:hypothetical protein